MAQRSQDNHYLTLLLPSFRKYSDALAFRPYLGRDDDWGALTYRQVEQRICVTRTHWERVLGPLGLKPLDVVGCWLTGRKFSDLLNTLALSSLGYTPQLFGSGDFQNVAVIFDLISKSDGKALILDPAHLALVTSSDAPVSVPHFRPFTEEEMLNAIAKEDEEALSLKAEDLPLVGRDDLAVLYHSSGTTGGMPKIIPNTFKMVCAVSTGKIFSTIQISSDPSVQTTVNTIGSVAHIASFHIFLACLLSGACMVQTSGTGISVDEFLGLTRVCRLTGLALFATFLANLIRAARKNDAILDALKGLQWIVHAGVALNKEEEEWAYEQGIKLMTSYSTTETGPLMRSRLGADPSSRLLRPIPSASPTFLPYTSPDGGSLGAGNLFELVLSGDADDCPPPALRAADGYYHTNDIFERVEEDGYVYRGRGGDWIKTAEGFVDTKAIEDMTRKSCEDIVHDAVVLGSGRLFPCLAIESKLGGLDEPGKTELAQTIVERLARTSARLFPHERIENPKRVIVVDQGTFVRTETKGNVKRPMTEAKLSRELEEIYRTS